METVIFMFFLTLHNIEEALWLPEWSKKNMPNKRRSPNRQHFIFAVIGITILEYAASGLYLIFPQNSGFEFCFIGCVGSMLINAFIPHVLLTIRYRKYCPGVLTACLLLIPFNSIILYNAYTSHLKISEILISTLIVGTILLVAIPLFEYLARRFLKGLC
jgi:hypothetical protein